MKGYAPATERNRAPIAAVLGRVLPNASSVLEVASGTGEHAVHFARALPHLDWQPTDTSPTALASIEAWRAEANLPNLRAPLVLDATGDAWPVARTDAVVCINMIHIAPWAACLGLMRGASRVLPAGGVLVLYGPFCRGGAFDAPSNEVFDASLRGRDPAWGVRDLDDVTRAAAAEGLAREEIVAMPAHNHTIVFRRSPGERRAVS